MGIDAIKHWFMGSLYEGVARESWVLAKHVGCGISRGLGIFDHLIIARYLRRHHLRKLNIGCGLVPLEGWLNADVFPVNWSVVRMNATRRFPFGDEVFDYVFTEHMIEHVTYLQGRKMLRECFRVLKPAGKIRISTPDLAFLIRVYGMEKSEMLKAYLDLHWKWSTPWAPSNQDTFFINNFVRDWRHQFIYDEKVLRQAMKDAGFRDITRCPVGESGDGALRGIENVCRMPEGFVEMETFTLEGSKP